MGTPFGGLSCPEFVPDFRDTLCETGQPHLLATVLDSIENGRRGRNSGSICLPLRATTASAMPSVRTRSTRSPTPARTGRVICVPFWTR